MPEQNEQHISELESIFLQLTQTDWNKSDYIEHFSTILSVIERHHSTYLALESVLLLLDKYLSHTNWKYRVCGLGLLFSYIKANFRRTDKIPLKLEEWLWPLFCDPDPTMLNYLVYGLRWANFEWYDYKTLTFRTPKLPQNHFLALDLPQLLQRLHKIDPAGQGEFFWGAPPDINRHTTMAN